MQNGLGGNPERGSDYLNAGQLSHRLRSAFQLSRVDFRIGHLKHGFFISI